MLWCDKARKTPEQPGLLWCECERVVECTYTRSTFLRFYPPFYLRIFIPSYRAHGLPSVLHQIWVGLPVCVHVWEGVYMCGRVCVSVGGCVHVWEGVYMCGRVCICVGGCVHVWEGVYMCGMVCI